MNRREFLKTSLLGAGVLVLRPFQFANLQPGGSGLARIAIESVSVYSQPWDESRIVYTRYRDEIIHLYYEVVSEKGPAWNPIWYRVWGGYIHSKSLQIVEDRTNIAAESVREEGQLAEVTVPFVQSMRNRGAANWEPLYRLYYGSVHWVVKVLEGPDGRSWYRLEEPWGKLSYDVPGEGLRLIPDEELSPLSPQVPPDKKRIEISIYKQELTAYEEDQAVFQTKVSTGLSRNVPKGQIPWTTPTGTWRITSKMPTQHMGNGNLTSDVDAYELAGVPWVCFFHVNGNATHGTYWHTNFGNPMSHGCVNMRIEDARWIFRWSNPVWSPNAREKRGSGTTVIVS